MIRFIKCSFTGNMDASTAEPQNPLLLNLVIKNVFELADFATLDECRNVCELWREVATKPWCEKSPVRIAQQNRHKSGVIDFMRRHKGTNSWAASRFNKFQLSYYDFGNQWMFDYKLWKTHGNLITLLELKDCKITTPLALKNLLLCKATPVLQTLKLTCVKMTFSERRPVYFDDAELRNPVTSLRNLEIRYGHPHNCGSMLPVYWKCVLQCYSQLQCLVLGNFATGCFCELARLMNGFQKFCEKFGHPHPLKTLNVSEGLDQWTRIPALRVFDSMAMLIREKIKLGNVSNHQDGLHLGGLGLIVHFPNDQDHCYTILAQLQATLKKVLIRSKIVINNADGPDVMVGDLRLPMMQQLTRLDLIDYCPLTFKFLLGCKNLKHLNIILKNRSPPEFNNIKPRWDVIDGEHEAESGTWGIRDQSQLVFLPSIKSFHCNLIIDWHEMDMLELGKCMPGLASLLIRSTESGYRGICQSFSRLERLYLYDSQLSDLSFTGTNGQDRNTTLCATLPNVTGFKHLQVLGIHSLNRDYCTPTTAGKLLTEVAVTKGLLQMSSLKQIHVSELGMTQSGIDALHKTDFEVDILGIRREFSTLAMTPF